MMKKILAAIGLIGIMSTTTASALTVGASGATAPITTTYFTNFTVSNGVINPKANETVKASFTLAKNADLTVNVTAADGSVVATFVPAGTPTVAGPFTYSWTAKIGNIASGTPLAEGTYTVNATAAVNGASVDNVNQPLTVIDLSPKISGLTFDPKSFSASTGQDTDAYFSVSKGGFLTAKIKQGNVVKRNLTGYNNEYYDASSHSISWDGLDDNGQVVDDGVYTIEVTASNDMGSNVATSNVTVATTAPLTVGSMKNFSLNPAGKWNPVKGGLDIKYQLVDKIKSLHIQAKLGNKVVNVLDDKMLSSDHYTETWDGTDNDGNYVDEGTWAITIIADGVSATQNVNVKYDQPAIVEAFVTKDSFDPAKGETENLVFKIDTKSSITVEAIKGATKETTLIDSQVVEKNKWYTVSWNGQDMDGADVNYGTDWKFKITAKNTTDQDLLASKNAAFKVEEDTVSDKKSNVTNDTTDPSVFDDQQSDSISLNYSIDTDAQVFAAVYAGNTTGGKAKITLLNYEDQSAGDHTVSWDGRDEKGKTLADGIYTYKIISKANGSYKETELGTFVIGNRGEYIEYISTNPNPKPNPKPNPNPTPDPIYQVSTCGSYTDTAYLATQNPELCEAIDWATQQGIFQGFSNGTMFAANAGVARQDVLKTIFLAFPNATVLPMDGTNQGFYDANPSEWYMPYIRTAKFYGMLQGYKDGSAGINKYVSRAEFLKFALKGSAAFAGYTIPQAGTSFFADVNVSDPSQVWMKDFAGVAYTLNFFNNSTYLYPNTNITRGEVALVLYKMYNDSMLNHPVARY